MTLLPALFMTMVTGSFLVVTEKEGFGSFLSRPVGYGIGAVITLAVLIVFLLKTNKKGREGLEELNK